MSKVLIIPDVHLKPKMFYIADNAMHHCDFAVVLGDLVDDWGLQDNKNAYAETIEAAIEFDEKHLDTLWCYGNHDYCYRHFDEGIRNSGFSDKLKHFVNDRLKELESTVGDRYKIIHQVDDVLFSHAGICAEYIERIQDHLLDGPSLAECIEYTNTVASAAFLWQNDSPLWLRPNYDTQGVDDMFQVAWHTPVVQQTQMGDILVVDTFSIYRNRIPIGNQTLTLYDTETHTYELLY